MPPEAWPKRILITSVFGYQNRGDWQLTISLLRILEETFQDCRIDALCRSPETQAAWFPDVTFHRLLGISLRAPGVLRFLESSFGFASGLMRTAFSLATGIGSTRLSRLYRDADIVVAAAGGYLTDANVSILMHSAHIWLGVLAGKPVVLAPQSVGPLETRLWRRLMRRLLARVDAVCVRDQPSHALARRLMGADERLRLMPDLAFLDDSADCEAAERELLRLGLWSKPFVCLTVSNGSMANYAGPPPVEGLLECLARFCEKLREAGFQVLVWTHVDSDAGIAGDEAAMREFSDLAPPNVVVSYARYDPSVVRGIFHYSAAVVAQRLHPCIFAAQRGRPLVAMATGPKFAGVLSMLELEKFVLDGTRPDEDSLYERFRAALAEPAAFMGARERARELGERTRFEFKRTLVECWQRTLRQRALP